jgi:hypothetical protein
MPWTTFRFYIIPDVCTSVSLLASEIGRPNISINVTNYRLLSLTQIIAERNQIHPLVGFRPAGTDAAENSPVDETVRDYNIAF